MLGDLFRDWGYLLQLATITGNLTASYETSSFYLRDQFECRHIAEESIWTKKVESTYFRRELQNGKLHTLMLGPMLAIGLRAGLSKGRYSRAGRCRRLSPLGNIQTDSGPNQELMWHLRGLMRQECETDHPSPPSAVVIKLVEPYHHSPMCLRGVMINQLNSWMTLHLTFT
jgi:hypothetical protein